MIALSTISALKAEQIFKYRHIIIDSVENGSVITWDAGIKTLAGVACFSEEYNGALFPYLIEKLKTCIPKSIAQYSESVFPAVTEKNRVKFVEILNERIGILNPSQKRRVNKLLGNIWYAFETLKSVEIFRHLFWSLLDKRRVLCRKK